MSYVPYDIIRKVPYNIIRNVNTVQNEEWHFKPGCISRFYRKYLFEKTLYNYRIYVRCFDECVKRKILQDFDLFTEVYDDIIDGRKHFISRELVLYIVLKHNDLQFCVQEFKPFKSCHIDICERVLEKFNWPNIYISINKMDEAVQTFVNYVMENCKTADQIQELLKTIKNALDGTDSCDSKINTCC